MHTQPARTNWLSILVLFCAGLMASMQFAKLSPVMQQAAADMQASTVTAGLFVSVLGLVGVLLAITVAAIANAVGLERSLRWAMFGGAFAACAGAFATESTVFLAIRTLEGLSHLFIVVCAPAMMANAASPRDRPIALSLWGCFFGAGYAITSAVAPHFITAGEWRNLLLAHGLAMLLVAVAVSVVTKPSPQNITPLYLRDIARKHVDVLTSGAPLVLALTFFAYTIQFLAALTFLVIFLSDVRQWPIAQVGIALSIAPLWSLLFTFVSGILVRLGLGIFAGFVMAFAALAISSFIVFASEPSNTVLFLALAVAMACYGLLPGLAFANLPRVATTPERATLTFSAIALFGNLGTFLGTPVLAKIHSDAGWTGVGLAFVLVCIIGTGLAFALARKVAVDDSEKA